MTCRITERGKETKIKIDTLIDKGKEEEKETKYVG